MALHRPGDHKNGNTHDGPKLPGFQGKTLEELLLQAIFSPQLLSPGVAGLPFGGGGGGALSGGLGGGPTPFSGQAGTTAQPFSPGGGFNIPGSPPLAGGGMTIPVSALGSGNVVETSPGASGAPAGILGEDPVGAALTPQLNDEQRLMQMLGLGFGGVNRIGGPGGSRSRSAPQRQVGRRG